MGIRTVSVRVGANGRSECGRRAAPGTTTWQPTRESRRRSTVRRTSISSFHTVVWIVSGCGGAWTEEDAIDVTVESGSWRQFLQTVWHLDLRGPIVVQSRDTLTPKQRRLPAAGGLIDTAPAGRTRARWPGRRQSIRRRTAHRVRVAAVLRRRAQQRGQIGWREFRALEQQRHCAGRKRRGGRRAREDLARPPGPVLRMSTPGAAMSMKRPCVARPYSCDAASTAVTAITFSIAAG